jgi:hypothetical protein
MLAALALLVSMAPAGIMHAGRSPWSVPRPIVSVELEPRAEAAREFVSGEAAYRTGDYAAASEHFARAYAIVPHPSTLYNLGMAQERAGDRVAAWNTYDQLVKEALSSTDRRDALAARDRVRPTVALLEIRARSSTAVCVDGEHVDVHTNIVLAAAPGPHDVSVGGETTRLDLQAGETHMLDVRRNALFDDASRSRAMVPLLVTTSVGAGVATGLGIAAATSASAPLRQGLGAGAAAASGIAFGTAVAALVVHTRPRRERRRGRTPNVEPVCPTR